MEGPEGCGMTECWHGHWGLVSLCIDTQTEKDGDTASWKNQEKSLLVAGEVSVVKSINFHTWALYYFQYVVLVINR